MLSVTQTIKRRVSCRTFRHEPLAVDTRHELEDFLQSNTSGPFGNRLEFQILDLSELEREEIKSLGTYGVIKGTSLFIAGTVSRGHKALEDFGYGMERNILFASSQGLGTCWLGGTFNRSGFARKLRVTKDELMPAITPVGYPADKRALVDHVFRFFAASHKRKHWKELFFLGNTQTPLDEKVSGAYSTGLDCVRIGPSASNKQPWRIIKEKKQNIFHFCLERSKGYDTTNKEIRLQNLDMGIAMCHFELSANELGLKGSWIGKRPNFFLGNLEYIVTWIED